MKDPVPHASRSPFEHERDCDEPIRTPAEALEAARVLAAQAAEIERLRARVSERTAVFEAASDRADAAEADAEKLRAALAFLRPSQWEQDDICGITFDSRWLAEHIDAALERKP